MVASAMSPAVIICIDDLKDILFEGFYKDDEGLWQFSKWRAVGDLIVLLCKNFSQNIVIDGYVDGDCLEVIQSNIHLDYAFLLVPVLETALKRNATREPHLLLSEKDIVHHYAHFNSPIFCDFARINSTDQSTDETFKTISDIINAA